MAVWIDTVTCVGAWQPGQPIRMEGEYCFVFLRIQRTAKFKKIFGKVPRQMVAGGSSDIFRDWMKPGGDPGRKL